jgi:hypothetical protein
MSSRGQSKILLDKKRTTCFCFSIRHLILHYVNVFNHVVHPNVLYLQHVQLSLVVISLDVHVVAVYKDKRVIFVQIQINARIQCARKNYKDLIGKEMMLFVCF